MIYLILILAFLCGCTEQNSRLPPLEIPGRSDPETLSSRKPVYKIRVPEGWDVTLPSLDLPLIDTTEPLLTLSKDGITVTFHNFPLQDPSQQVPPMAQIERWKKQFRELYEITVVITPFSVSGFTGLQFEAKGIAKGTEMGMMAWTMLLTPELFSKFPDNANQEKGDWTLKAFGPLEKIDLHRSELLSLARSVELIREIPQR
jgi:hypothetical protein